MSEATEKLTEIYPPRGMERLARNAMAIEKDGRFFIENSREDEQAIQIKRMFGSDAARRRRENGPVIATAAATPYKPTLADHPQMMTATPKNNRDATPHGPALEDILLGENTKMWSWAPGVLQPGYNANESFSITGASLDRKTGTLRITTEGASGEKEVVLRGDPTNLRASFDRQLNQLLIETQYEAQAANTAELNANANTQDLTQEPDPGTQDVNSEQELFDDIIANTAGATGPAVEWMAETLDRPQTLAKSKMRAVVTSSGIETGPAGSKTLKMVLDYQPFATHNQQIADGGRCPRTYEMIQIQVSSAEGGDNNALAKKLARVFSKIDSPLHQVEESHISAKAMRTTDVRLKMAELANTMVEQSGQVPPAPVPKENPSPVASRVYFWTAKEDESRFCYRKLIATAQAAGVPLLVDRNKNSEHWGLRYAELTRDEVEKLPGSLTAFISPAAHEAHLESKRLRDSSRRVIADAAATAAIEVISKKPDYQADVMRPLTVPHPDLDPSGWERARAALYNIDKDKLLQLMDLTWKRKSELELEEDKLATIGQRISRDKASKIAMWGHGLKLGERILQKSGMTWTEPSRRQEQANSTDIKADQGTLATSLPTDNSTVEQTERKARGTLSLKAQGRTKSPELQIQN